MSAVSREPSAGSRSNRRCHVEDVGMHDLELALRALVSRDVPLIVRQKAPADVYSTAYSVVSASASVTALRTAPPTACATARGVVPRIVREIVRVIVREDVRGIVREDVRGIARRNVRLKVPAIVGFNVSCTVSAKATGQAVSGPMGGRQNCGLAPGLYHRLWVSHPAGKGPRPGQAGP
jgi:hypothetical protein